MTGSMNGAPAIEETALHGVASEPSPRYRATAIRSALWRALIALALASTAAAAFLAGALFAGQQRLEWFTGKLAGESEVEEVRASAAAAATAAARADMAAELDRAAEEAASAGEARGYDRGHAEGYEQGLRDGQPDATSTAAEAFAGAGCDPWLPDLPIDELWVDELHPAGIVTYCIDVPEPNYYLFYAHSSEADLVMSLYQRDGQKHYSDDEFDEDPALEGVYLDTGRHRLQIAGFDLDEEGAFDVSWYAHAGD